MKTRNTGYCSTGAARASGFSMGRRQLLLLGMLLTGTGLLRRILHSPPRTPGQGFADKRLSRHEASFYTTPDKEDG
jgi:hypothetical protein